MRPPPPLWNEKKSRIESATVVAETIASASPASIMMITSTLRSEWRR